MPQFDVYAVRQSENLVVDVQHRLLGDLGTRVVIPLSRVQNVQAPTMTPVICVRGQEYVLLAPAITSVRTRYLANLVENVEDQRHVILGAIDRLFSGV